MDTTRRRAARALVAAALSVLTLLAGLRPAAATDIDIMRARAQRVADQVTELERRLESLRTERSGIDLRITRSTQRIALLEVDIHETEAELEDARSVYVARAVEAYKAGSTSGLDLVLSSQSMSSMIDAAEAVGEAAKADVEALERLVDAIGARERAQTRLDERKQQLLADQRRNEELSGEIEQILGTRRSTLAELNEEIARLEEQARLQALAPGADFAELLAPTGPAPDIPKGYVGTGVAFEGIASWYGPGFEGQTTANGEVFDPDLFTAASRDLPFGTTLFVTYQGRGVVVVINDRGPFIEERILDLSQAAAEAIGLGLGWVSAEIVVPVER